MTITRKTKRRLSPMSRELADLHNDLSRAAGKARRLATRVDEMERHFEAVRQWADAHGKVVNI